MQLKRQYEDNYFVQSFVAKIVLYHWCRMTQEVDVTPIPARRVHDQPWTATKMK